MEKSGERPLAGATIAAIAVFLALFIVGALAVTNPPAEAPSQPVYTRHPLNKLDRDLTLDRRGASVEMGEEARVIIRLNTQPTTRSGRISSQDERRDSFEQAKSEVLKALSGGVSAAGEDGTVKDLRIINSIALTVPTRKLNDLAYIGAVEYISEDKPVHTLLDNSVALVGAPQVWAMNDSLGLNVTGQNVTIAIIDTGIDYTHPDLGNCTSAVFLAGNCSKVIAGYDFYNGDSNPMDDNGHGTHVAGIAAANGTLKGVAPDATLVAYKVLDSNGDGYTSDVILAIQNATAAGYDIISLSLGTSGNPDDALSQAVDTAVNSGIVVVAAAGNSGPELKTIRSPGTARKAITVGNTYDNDTIRSTSSRGPVTGDVKPDLTAPGVDIYSTVPTGSCELCDSSGYANSTGTSMSAPHVSGAAALLLQKNPTWTPAMVKGALVGYTKNVGLRAVDQGSGRLAVNRSIDAQIIGSSVSLSLSTVSTRLTNTTASFTIRNLLNLSINVTLSSAVVTNTNASSSLNQSWVNISALGNASIALLVNWSAGTEGYVDGRISADNLTILFMFEIAGFRTIELENIGANDEIPDVLIRDIDNDGLNELIMSYDEPNGRVRSAKYNSITNTWNLTTIATIPLSWVEVVNAEDIDNDTLTEVVSGDWDAVFRVFEHNASDASWIESYNYSTGEEAIEDIKIGDVDNDSITEVLLTTYLNGGTGEIWQFKLMNGTWNHTILHKKVYGNRFYGMDVGDVDNDDLLEIVWHNYTASINYIVVGNYVNGTWNHSVIDTFPGTVTNLVQGIAIGDADEDGENEIIVGGGNTTYGWVRLYNYNGSSTWNETEIYNESGGSALVPAVGDANNDGATDIVVGFSKGLGVRLLERNSDNVTYTRSVVIQSLAGGAIVRGVDIGDATNNGLNEITSGSGFAGPDAVARLHYLIEDPRISNLQKSVSQPTKLDIQTLTARVQDSDGLSSVTLYWRNGTVDWQIANMTRVDTQNYTANVSAQPWNTTVEYFIRATDTTGASNQTPIYNYTVRVNRLGNASTLLTNLSNVTVWIAGNQTLNATYYGSALVEIRWNGTVIVEFNFSFPNNVLDLRNVTLNASQDNLTGWILVRNLSLPSGTNKTLYLQHLNTSAGFVCVKDAEVSSIDNISASCAGTNETLIECNNVSVSGYRCENVSNWWKVTGAAHTAIKEMGNAAPQITATSPSGTVTSSSTTLSATTNEAASCKYSTTQGQAYSAMPSTFSTTGGTSHSQALTGLSNGAYTYYALCQDSNGANSTESAISFTVSITTSSGGGGGGAAPTPIDQNKKETTYASLTADKVNTLFVDRSTIAATKVGFVNTVAAQNVKLSVSTVEASDVNGWPEKAYGYFNVTLEGLYAHELKEAWLEFKVNTSWITGNGATKDDVRLKRHSNTWQELKTLWMKDSGDYSYFNATTPGFSLFAIGLAAKEPEPEPVEPEPEVNITTEPEVNITVEPPEPPQPPQEKPSAWKWFGGIALALLTAAALILLGKRIAPRRAKRAPREPREERLRRYIAKCREEGYSDEEIRKSLLKEGWNKDVIESALG